MQIEKALVNDLLSVLKVFWKFPILTMYKFAVIYPWNLLFSQKVAYFLAVLCVGVGVGVGVGVCLKAKFHDSIT